MIVLALGLLLWLCLVWLHDHRLDRPRWWRPALGLPPLLLVVMALLIRSDPVLQKLAGRLIMPTGILWAALGPPAAAAWLRRRRRAATVWSVVFVGYSVAGSPLLSILLMNHLESSVPAYDIDDGPAFEAVFVLGGGSDEGPSRIELGPTGDRILLGALLHKAGKAPVLVASGRSIAGMGPPRDLSAETESIWLELGVPRSAIVRLPEPYNTSQEMRAYARLIAERGWTRTGLITSAFHLPRALRLAESHGLTMTPIAADHRSSALPPAAVALVPNGRAFERMSLAFWELVGRWVGR